MLHVTFLPWAQLKIGIDQLSLLKASTTQYPFPCVGSSRARHTAEDCQGPSLPHLPIMSTHHSYSNLAQMLNPILVEMCFVNELSFRPKRYKSQRTGIKIEDLHIFL